jgi:hypothetical protein
MHLLLLIFFCACNQAEVSIDKGLEPFDLSIENNTDNTINIQLAFWEYCPDPKPLNTYNEEYYQITVFLHESPAHSNIIQQLKGYGFGPHLQPNQGLRYNLAGVEFLDSDGVTLLDYYDINQNLIIEDGAGDWVNIWETPPEADDPRPFYLELDEDGITGRIIIVKEPTAP